MSKSGSPLPASDFRVRYRFEEDRSAELRDTAVLAERSFADYVPCAFAAAVSESAGGCARSVAPDEVAREITDILLTSPHARKSAGPDVQNRAEIARRAVPSICRGEPIPALMVWSPKKHWVSGEASAVDVAELVALQTFFDINVAVKQAYAPGVHFYLRVEDVEHAFMCAGSVALEEDMERYISRLGAAILVLGLQNMVTVSRTSSLARDDREIEAWRSRLEQNFAALRAYWHDSEKRGCEGFEQYDTYKALASLGWQGPIPREMRDFYLVRIHRGLGRGETVADAADRALRNLAGILLHRQENLLRVGDHTPLIVSFVAQPRGTPWQLALGRVNLRFAPPRLGRSVNNAPPWSVKGCLRGRKGKLLPTFTSWQEPLGSYAQDIAGTFDLTRGELRVPVRADLLLHNRGKGSAQRRERALEPEA
jgi:hypothetical protein